MNKKVEFFDVDQFRKDVIQKRTIEMDISLDEAAEKIGIPMPVLLRIEHHSVPSIETFARVVIWLNKNPNRYFTPVLK